MASRINGDNDALRIDSNRDLRVGQLEVRAIRIIVPT